MDYPRPSRLSEPLGRLRDLVDIYGHTIPGHGPAWGVVAAADARGPTSTRQRRSTDAPVQPQYFPARADAFGSSGRNDAALIQYYDRNHKVDRDASDIAYQRRLADVRDRQPHDGFIAAAVSGRNDSKVQMQPRENFSPGIPIGSSLRGQNTR